MRWTTCWRRPTLSNGYKRPLRPRTPAEASRSRSRLGRAADAEGQGERAGVRIRGVWRPRQPAAAPGHGPGRPDDDLAGAVLPDARQPRLLRGALRQP